MDNPASLAPVLGLLMSLMPPDRGLRGLDHLSKVVLSMRSFSVCLMREGSQKSLHFFTVDAKAPPSASQPSWAPITDRSPLAARFGGASALRGL